MLSGRYLTNWTTCPVHKFVTITLANLNAGTGSSLQKPGSKRFAKSGIIVKVEGKFSEGNF